MFVSKTTVFFPTDKVHLVDEFAPWKQLSGIEQSLYSDFISLTKDSLKKETNVLRQKNDDGSMLLVFETIEDYSHELFLETYYLFFGRELGDKLRSLFPNECKRLGLNYEITHADVAQW